MKLEYSLSFMPTKRAASSSDRDDVIDGATPNFSCQLRAKFTRLSLIRFMVLMLNSAFNGPGGPVNTFYERGLSSSANLDESIAP